MSILEVELPSCLMFSVFMGQAELLEGPNSKGKILLVNFKPNFSGKKKKNLNMRQLNSTFRLI